MQSKVKKTLLICLTLLYVCGASFGSLAHNLLHHFADQKHHHTLPCLTQGASERPADEVDASAKGPGLSAQDCSFKLALHRLSRLSTRDSPPAATELTVLVPQYEGGLKADNIFKPEVLISSNSSRGPPRLG